MEKTPHGAGELDDLAVAMTQHRETPAYASREMVSRRVGFWPRAGAALLDGIVYFGAMAAYGFTLSYLDSAGRLTPMRERLLDGGLMLFIAMYTLQEVFLAATPGKWVLGQRIAAADGSPLSPTTLILRWTFKNGYVILNLVAVVAGVAAIELVGSLWSAVISIGCLAVLGRERLAFHDRWAGTAVYPKQKMVDRGFEPLPIARLTSPSIASQARPAGDLDIHAASPEIRPPRNP